MEEFTWKAGGAARQQTVSPASDHNTTLPSRLPIALALVILAASSSSCGTVAPPSPGPADASSEVSDASNEPRSSDASSDTLTPHADSSDGSRGDDGAATTDARADSDYGDLTPGDSGEAGDTATDGAGAGDTATDGGGADGESSGTDAAPVHEPVDAATDSSPLGESCNQRKVSTDGVFVDAARGTDAPDCGGAFNRACKTIQTGIARATGIKSIVYIAAGVYEESISLASGLTLDGGWTVDAAGWTPVCTDTSSAVTIRAPGSASATVRADALAEPATLSRLTVMSKAAANPTESLYGVFVTGATTQLTLRDVQIVVADGGDGSDGTPGAGGTNGATTGCTPAGDGGNGLAAGSPGVDGRAGAFEQTGYKPGNGTVGGEGQPGHNGTAGGAGTVVTCGTCANSYSSDCRTAAESRGTAGLAGCGGAGGKGGGAATGGGSSVALYVWEGSVNIVDGGLKSGNGGVGGKGGRGGTPGVGTHGAVGTAGGACTKCQAQCASKDAYGQCTSMGCATVSTSPGSAGTPGGLGGNGTVGGDGGAGSGGSSFAIYKGATATVTASSGTTLSSGLAGTSRGGAASGTAKPIGP